MTKTYRHLWDQIASFEALHTAYLKARRDKRYEYETLVFSANLEDELVELLDELRSGRYRTGDYQRFFVHDPKTREVAALRFRDRVVQHALVAAMEPIYEHRFIADSFACRSGRGIHAATDRFTEFLRRAHRKWDQTYVLKADVCKYFASVDHGRLKAAIRRYIACPPTLAVIDEIVESWNAETGKGMPIGNLTSQLFANIYLHELDEFIKYERRWKFYLRYMDDFLLIGPNKAELQAMKFQIGEFLADRLCLSLNPKTDVYPTAQGIPFIGFRFWRTHRLLRKDRVQRTKRYLKSMARKYREGRIGAGQIQASIMAWIGHAKHANTYRLREHIFGNVVFSKS